MIFWKQLRPVILALTFGSTLFTLGRATLDPNLGKYTPYAFPPAVSLPGWQLLESTPLNNADKNETHLLAGKRYQYINNSVPLDIEIRYEIASVGEIKEFLPKYTSIPSLPNKPFQDMRQQEGVGYYVVFTYQNRAYLSSCINPLGGSTVSSQQFANNRNNYDVQLNRVFPWLIGQADLRDWRCLWTHISIPLNKVNTDSVEQNYKVLENVWFYWYKWWSPRFPKL